MSRFAPLAGLFSAFLLVFCLNSAVAGAAAHGPRLERATVARGVAAKGHGHRGRARKRVRPHGRAGIANGVGLTGPRQRSRPSQLLFDGSHISDFDLVQAAPNAIQEVPDPTGSGETAMEMTVNDGDVAPITPTDNPRAQELSPPIIEAGDEFWLQTKFLIPQNFPSVHGWLSLVSVYGAPFEGSSPWQIEVSGNELMWMRNGTYNWDVPWRMPLVKGSWVSVLTHERFAHDGWVEMWIDGQQVEFFGSESRLQMQTMDSSNDAGANAAKIMQYRERGMFNTGSIYFGPLKLGTTRSSVGA